MLHVHAPAMTLCMPRSVERPAMVKGLLTPARTPPKIPLSFLETTGFTQVVPQTPYLSPQSGSTDSVASSLTLHFEKEQLETELDGVLEVEDEELVRRHPLDPPDYTLKDLPDTKANSILYQEFENRTEKVLLQPDVENHLKRSKQRIKWAKIGGGGTCSQRLIDNLSRRIQFLEQCLRARKALTEGKYAAEVLKVKHDDLVRLEKTIGGFWARPRRVGKEWRYLSQELIGELADEPETLDGLEEFSVVNDLLHTIISSTGLCNLLLFGTSLPQKKRDGYFEDRMMGEQICNELNVEHENKMHYVANGQSVLIDGAFAPPWIYEAKTIEARAAIVADFVSASLPDSAEDGKVRVWLSSWSDGVFEVDVEQEPRPLSFKEKDHLAQRAAALKDHLRHLLSNNAVLHHADTEIHEYATVGPSGVNIGFRGYGRIDDGFVFPTTLGPGEDFKDTWNGGRCPEEINHRGEEFNVLRGEFEHAIQCWWYLWQQYGEEIKGYLFQHHGEVDGNVEEPTTLDDHGSTTLEGTTPDQVICEEQESFEHSLHYHQPPAEILHDSGEIESFSIEEEEEGDSLIDDFTSSPPSTEDARANYSSPPSSFTNDQEPAPKPLPLKHQIEEPTAPSPKRRRISYLRKFNIHPSHLDGASRVCPETGETWWADSPPYFMFGETPTMASFISDQMKEDLRKGQEDLAKGSDFFAGGSKVSALPENEQQGLEEKGSPSIVTAAKHVGTASEPIEIDEEPIDGDMSSDDETIVGSNSSSSQDEDMEDAGQASDHGEEPDSEEESDSDSGEESSDLDSEPSSDDDSSEYESEPESKEKVDSSLGPGKRQLTAKGNASETIGGKVRQVAVSTSITTSHNNTPENSSQKKSISSARKTPAVMKAESIVSRKSTLSTTNMTTSTPYACDDCGGGFSSVEVAALHADGTGHLPKHFDTQEHQAVFGESARGYEEELDAEDTAVYAAEDHNADEEVYSGEEEWNGFEQVNNEEGELYAEEETGSDKEGSYADEKDSSAEMELDAESEEEEEGISGDEDMHNERDIYAHEERLCHQEVVDSTPHEATHSKQSATVYNRQSVPAVKTSVQKTRTVIDSRNNPIVFKKITTAVTTTTHAMEPRTTTYKTAREIAPNDFQCGVIDCDFHDNPRRLSRHVMTHHPGNIKDWTVKGGFKCEWKDCSDRYRLATGLYQHCVDVHLPPVPKLVPSTNLSRLPTAPNLTKEYRVAAAPRLPVAPRVLARPQVPTQAQHSRDYNQRVEKTHSPHRAYTAKPEANVDSCDSDLDEEEIHVTDAETEEIENDEQNTTHTAQSSLPDYEDYECPNEDYDCPDEDYDCSNEDYDCPNENDDCPNEDYNSATEDPKPQHTATANETILPKPKQPSMVDSDSECNSDSDPDSDSDSEPDIPTTPAVQKTPATAPPVRGGWGSLLFTPFKFLSGGQKRKRTEETKEEAAETPVRSGKKVRFEEAARAGKGRRGGHSRERVREMEMVGR
ncbi:hypothetical protein BLS_010045 [Venturia inaequalis]|uniref:C2H2-type domain-containing protein n=1 Tax=Venturia inaequalis TaxID=5025 RepID=A0A8H3UYT1_VENIN|nr:hypothetical protein BLS_010045 [Venturia inaequalis]